MKIIDTHTHFPGACLGAAPRPINEIREEFEKAGLYRAWIFTTDGLFRETAKNNDILAEAVSKHRDFFIPFCTVNPHDGEDTAIREMERAVFDLKMRGLKLHPWLQAFSLTNPAVLPIMRKAGQLNIPVIFHDGSPPYSTPLQIAAAAEKCPETTVILGHAGLDDLYQDAIFACLRQPNIYLCCCSLSSGYIREIIRQCPSERLLYGSDAGFTPGIIETAVEKVKDTGVPEGILEQIFYENPSRFIP